MFANHMRAKGTVELVSAEPATEEEDSPTHESPLTVWGRIVKDWGDLRINKTLFVILPLIILIELVLNLSMDIIPPDHDVHVSTYCATCGFNVGDNFSVFAVGATTEYLKSVASCMEDAMLLLIGEAFQAFNTNYVATLLGHILTVYALMASLDGSLTPKSLNLRSILHGTAYALLLIDVAVEFGFLYYIDSKDPTEIDVMNAYDACDDTVVSEIIDVKDMLVEFAIEMAIWRTCVAAVVTIIYIIEVQTVDEDEEDVKEGENEVLVV